MDEDWLREEVESWVEEGLISESQGRAILARYGLAEAPDRVRALPRARLITVLSVMGAALIAAGVLVFLATVWEDLGRHARAAVAVGSTLAFLSGGALARAQYGRPRAGHALLTVGAVGIGVTAFLLDSIYGLDTDPQWLLAAWGGLALPLGHAVRSRPIVALALSVLAVWAGVAAGAELAVGWFALALFAVALAVRERGHARLFPAYRLVAVGGVLLTALLVVGNEVRFPDEVAGEPAVLAALVVAGLAGTVGVAAAARAERVPTAAAGWAVATTVVFGLTLALAAADPALEPALARVLVWHALTLGLLLATLWLGYEAGSSPLVNVAVAAFLLQVALALSSTVLEALSGAAALIVAGLVLLAAGLGLERGRRELLDRMERRGG